METTFQKRKQLTDLVVSLIRNNPDADISTISTVTKWAMEHLDLRFIVFTELMEDLGDYLYEATPFENTEEYFFDKINTSNISKNQIDVLVNRCVA